MLKKIALGAVLVVALFLAVVAAQPADYTVARSLSVQAPPAVVYAQVVDFRRWVAWSPWEKMEPDVQHTYSEPSAGLGASTTWKGEKTGEGAMKLTEATAPTRLGIELQFLKPFPSKSGVVFDLAADGAGTKVTWTMNGHNDLMGKAFALFVDMDAMLGKDFEQGLAGIKAVAEQESKAAEAAKAAEALAAIEAAAAAAAAPAEAADGGAPEPTPAP